MRTIAEWYRSGGPFILPLLTVAVVGLMVLIDAPLTVKDPPTIPRACARKGFRKPLLPSN